MKKTIKYLLMLISLITLSGCGNSATIKESRTIILEVDSEVNPTFSSNFGEGSYDETTKKYTHTIDYIKDLYIFLSYEDLKTVTVHIPTSEMKEKTIIKSVEFGEVLDAEVEVTIEGVKTLEGLQLSNELNYSNLQVGKKNTFKFTLPSREENYNLKFTLPNYKEFNINLTKEQLISGNAKIETIALSLEQIYIGFEGNNYEYKIYSSTTNNLIASGNNYENQSSIQYAVLPNNENYYVMVNGNRSRLHKVPVNENIVIDVGSNPGHMGYLNTENKNGNSYYETKLYDKERNVLQNGSSLYNSIDAYGLLVRNEDKWYYLSDLRNKVENQDGWNYKYSINLEDMIEVNFNVTRIDLMTKEVISSQIESDAYFSYDIKANYDEDHNIFSIINEEIKSGYVNIDLYNDENEKIGTIEKNIESYFSGEIYSSTILYKGRTIPYTFPIFVEDLVYSNGSYTYPKQIIDTDLSLLSIKFLDNNGNIQTLSSNDFIMDEEQEVIMGTAVGNETYFELHENKTYTFKHSNINYSFTVTEKDINSGIIFIVSENIEKVQVKVPVDYYLIVDQLNGMRFYPNSEGIVEVPVGEKTNVYASISNGYVEFNSKNICTEDRSIVEFKPFYVINGAKLYSGESYYSNSNIGSNGVEYLEIKLNDGYTDFPTYFDINVHAVDNNDSSYQKINVSDFTYNEEYKAYYYDYESQFDHVLILESESDEWRLDWSDTYYINSYWDENIGVWVYKAYVNNNTTISYDNGNENIETYTFTSSDAKKLNVRLEYNDQDGQYRIIVNEAN